MARGVIAGGLVALACLGLPVAASAQQLQLRPDVSWGTPGAGDGQFAEPTGIAAAPGTDVYVADTGNGRVQRFTTDGVFVNAVGAGALAAPEGVAVAPGSDVFVADTGNARIVRATPDGRVVTAWGTLGTGDGQFLAPTGVAIDPASKDVFVADASRGRVQRFTDDGVYIAGFDAPGRDVAVDPFGDVFVVDGARVRSFTLDGAPLTAFGTAGAGEGQFAAASGVGTDTQGSVLVADGGNDRVQAFTIDGVFDAAFRPGVSRPGDVAVGDGGLVFVTDRGNGRVLRLVQDSPPLPPPVLGRAANVVPVRGEVLVRDAGGAFTPLASPRQIKVGSELDTTRGALRLLVARDARAQQQAVFDSGRFVVRQARRAGAYAELTLSGGDFGACPPGSAARSAQKKKSKKVRRLWGNGRGRFRTKGRSAVTTVRGTRWLTEDRCDGTYVEVRRGVVDVRDLVRGRTVTLRAGGTYLARARRP